MYFVVIFFFVSFLNLTILHGVIMHFRTATAEEDRHLQQVVRLQRAATTSYHSEEDQDYAQAPNWLSWKWLFSSDTWYLISTGNQLIKTKLTRTLTLSFPKGYPLEYNALILDIEFSVYIYRNLRLKPLHRNKKLIFKK